MMISSLKFDNLLSFAIEGRGEIQQTVRKSIWHFIVSTYGKEKLAEIFYMTRLTRSAESGIITVLGVSLKTLTERWREWILQEASANADGRETLDGWGGSGPPAAPTSRLP